MPGTCLRLQTLEPRCVAAVFLVTNTADSGVGSLRAAMDAANSASGPDEIRFNIPGAGVQTIRLLSELPAINGPVIIDGTTQPGSAVNSASVGSNAQIGIEILGNGAATGFRNASAFSADGSIIRGLALGGFGTAIQFMDSFRTTVSGNWIGLRADGVTPAPNVTGLSYQRGYTHTIGGPTLADRNIISGNGGDGITADAPGVTIQGNLIGTNAAGTAFLGNRGSAIAFPSKLAENNTVVQNVLSGNGGAGLFATDATNLIVQGNFIGTNALGTEAIPNARAGILLRDTTTINGAPVVIGGDAPSQRNIVSGNSGTGMDVTAMGRQITVAGNWIGTDATGKNALPNGFYGLIASGNLLVGGFSSTAANLISGNQSGGVLLTGAVTMLNNVVGVSADGTRALPNQGSGVTITANSAATVGAEGAPNLIAFNTGAGVTINAPTAGYRLITNRIFGNGDGGIVAPSSGTVWTLQNVALENGSLKLTGTLIAAPGEYRVELFANSPGTAQGEQYLTALSLTVPASGRLDFVSYAPAPPVDRPAITATVSSPTAGRTSSFSSAVALPVLTPPAPPSPPTPPPISPPLPTPTVPPIVPVPDVVIRPDGTTPRPTNPPPNPNNLAPNPPPSAVPTPPGVPLLSANRATFAVGPGAGGGGVVRLFNPNASERLQVVPFPGFAGEVRTVTADINGDGIVDIVAAVGPGGPPQVRVFDGSRGELLGEFLAFEESFRGGLFVAAGDLDSDGRADIVITPDEGGGPRVQVRRGADLQVLTDFFGIDDVNFRGGARSAVGDVNGDGRNDLLVAAGFGGGPRIAIYNGRQLAINPARLVQDFYAFESTLRNGAFAALGDFTGDGKADLVFGAGPGGAPRVRVADAASVLAASPFGALDDVPTTQFATFFAGDTALRGGVRVATKDLDSDGRADLITGSGIGSGSRVQAYLAAALPTSPRPGPIWEFDAIPGFVGGVFVG